MKEIKLFPIRGEEYALAGVGKSAPGWYTVRDGIDAFKRAGDTVVRIVGGTEKKDVKHVSGEWVGVENKGNVSNERKSIKFESTYQERLAQTPVNNGEWTGQRGESTFIHDNKEIKEILSKVDKKGIDYSDAVPDFSPVSKGKVEIEGMSVDRNVNFKKADERLAEEWGVKPKEVRKWRKQNQYT
ncbi:MULTISPECIES: hypothetical protein [Bacillus]|uniref:hypothetical protein n=1 Tax=Bacillus TaxID=1386 RepID=UPI00030D56C0|nr:MULTISPECIES: hypothetical protein [Bacillus]